MDYVANPAQLITATLVGFVVLLFLIIKLKLHALLSVLIAGVIIGVGSGMPFSLVTQAVTDGMAGINTSLRVKPDTAAYRHRSPYRIPGIPEARFGSRRTVPG